jgi:hypothetical protein
LVEAIRRDGGVETGPRGARLAGAQRPACPVGL